MTAGAAQPRLIPRLESLHLLGGEDHQAGLGLAVVELAHLVPLVNDRSAAHPLAVLDAAPPLPAAAHQVSAVHGGRLPGWCRRPTRDHVRVGGINLARPALGQETTEYSRAAADHNAPADRAVEA